MPKIIGESLADHRGQVRQHLFESLSRLIAERGYAPITLAEIAAEAGVGRTAVYNHFPDKESVLLAMVQEQTAQYVDRLTAAVGTTDRPLEKLTIFLRMQFREMVKQHVGLVGIGSVLSGQGRSAIREHVEPMAAVLGDILADAMVAGDIPEQDVPTLAAMISAVTTGRFTAALDGESLEPAIDAAVTFVLRGVGARE